MAEASPLSLPPPSLASSEVSLGRRSADQDPVVEVANNFFSVCTVEQLRCVRHHGCEFISSLFHIFSAHVCHLINEIILCRTTANPPFGLKGVEEEQEVVTAVMDEEEVEEAVMTETLSKGEGGK